jgi:hypothetical protein
MMFVRSFSTSFKAGRGRPPAALGRQDRYKDDVSGKNRCEMVT